MRASRLLCLCAIACHGSAAFAEPLLEPPSPKPEPADDGPAAPLVPPAADTLGGHLVLAANASVVVPWGDLGTNRSAAELGPGYGFGVDLGYGIGRSLVIGVWGQFALHEPGCDRATDTADVCRATSYALGPFVRYHVVQGVRFDPWILAGLGFRGLSAELPADSHTYSGVEWLRLALGGDYYPASLFGFGPIAELDLGVFSDRPNGAGAAAIHFAFLGGIRLMLDVPGK